jgi:hypothetical protein
LLAVLLCGCASLSPWTGGTGARDHLEFLVQATAASPAAREQMWQDTANGPDAESRLRKALLQSILGSARYNPVNAETELLALLAENPPADVAAVARVRMESLRSYGECRAETEALKKRLAKIADIERGTAAPKPRKP